jgi:putative hydrolase of the HAD superfamily
MFEAVFFDAGETLVHPQPSFAELFALVLRREGYDVAADAVADRVLSLAEHFQRAARENELWTTSPERSKAFWLSVYGAFLSELQVAHTDALLEVLYAAFTDLANYAVFDDVVPVLEELAAAGMTLGVVSNFEEWLERLLEGLGISAFFDVRVISGIEGLEKPDPRIFRLAMERAAVAPDRVVYVGDNPALDIEAAARVGMHPVLIDRRERYPDAAGARITSMATLPAVIASRASHADAASAPGPRRP